MEAFSVAVVGLVQTMVWPALIVWVLWRYGPDIRSMLPRIRKAGPAGVELDAAEQQKEARNLPSSSTPTLQPIEGIARTPHLEALELRLLGIAQGIAPEKQISHLVAALARWQTQAAFEKIYRLIFGSQLRGLRLLNSRVEVSLDEASDFFHAQRETFAEPHNHQMKLSDWLQFLEHAELVKREGDKIRITDFGRDFLLWVTSEGLSEDLAL